MNKFSSDSRFAGIKPFHAKVWLASPTTHGDEQKWVDQAFRKNWISTVGDNINRIEKIMADYIGVQYAVALSSGTSALHLAIKLAGEKLYGRARPGMGTLQKHRVFCSDMTFAASVNPVTYEDGEAVFIDTEPGSWNMCPEALEKAFRLYPEVGLIVVVHLYGTPGRMEEIRRIARRHGAMIIEDAAEALGAKYKFNGQWVKCGNLGQYNCLSFNGNKIITGSSGGMFVTNDREDAAKVRKWSTQSREGAPWYQHAEIGYNYRMSNIIAGIIRGQFPYLEEHIAQKKAIYRRYKEGLSDLPVRMNPYDPQRSEPNFWLSCMVIDENAMCETHRREMDASYVYEPGKSCPTEILEALSSFNAEGRPIWKPMHMQPVYRDRAFIAAAGSDVGADIFRRGLCLPSDNKMTTEQQDGIIDIIHRCFQ